VGSIEIGKDGDPFEYTTHCLGVIIEGVRYPGETR